MYNNGWPPHMQANTAQRGREDPAQSPASYPSSLGIDNHSPWPMTSAPAPAMGAGPPQAQHTAYGSASFSQYTPTAGGWWDYGPRPSYSSFPPSSVPMPPSYGRPTAPPTPIPSWYGPPPPQGTPITSSYRPPPSQMAPIPPSYANQPPPRAPPPTRPLLPSYSQAPPRAIPARAPYGPVQAPAASIASPYSPTPSQAVPNPPPSYGQSPHRKAPNPSSYGRLLPPSDTQLSLPTSPVPLHYGSSPPPSAFVHPPNSQTSPPAAPIPPSYSEPPPRTTPIPPSDRGGYFSDAHDFNISNLNISHNQGTTSQKSVFDHLDPYIAHGAAHDSSERCYAPACHEETRVAVRQHIVSWIKHGEGDDEPKRIMWLSGPAGCGKTAIAGSVAEECKKEGLLAATFMFSSFSGSVDRQSKRCVVTTIASHLAEHEALQEFKVQLLLSIERNPSIFRKRLKDQAECLILGPLGSLQGRCDTKSWPKGIILDGLDEVVAAQHHDPTGWQPVRTSEEDQVEILEVLLALSQHPSFPFCIFISSRPERNITEFFATDAARSTTIELFLDSKYDPDADIRLFLNSKFADIRRRSWISDGLWPGEDVLDRLVGMSSGQFIVSTTIIRWIHAGVPQQQLKEVLQLQREAPAGSKNPFASLDLLYRHILQRAHTPDDDPHLVMKWILSIHLALNNETPPAQFWRQFFEDSEGELDYRMTPIRSLISIPPPNDTSSTITAYHKSLFDFLSVKARCGDDLYVDRMAQYSFISNRTLGVLKNKGPIVPRSMTPADLRSFLEHFEYLVLVNGNDPVHGGQYSSFVFYLAGDSDSRDLASCDVAWWTGMLLRSDLAPLGRICLCAILGSIHKAVKCDRRDTPPSTPHATQQTQDGQCHTACINWRTGILATAKELNWCVHELEEVKVDELLRLRSFGSEKMFKKMGKQPDGSIRSCEICQPGSSRIAPQPTQRRRRLLRYQSTSVRATT